MRQLSTDESQALTPSYSLLVRSIVTMLSADLQEAHLSQKGHAMRVTEYFAKSLNVTQDHSK